MSESSTVYDSAFILSAHSNSIAGNKTPVSAFVGEDKDIGFSVKSGCTTLSSTFLIWVSSPFVAVTLRSYIPASTFSRFPTVIITSPSALIDEGENDAVAPSGKSSTEIVVVVSICCV